MLLQFNSLKVLSYKLVLGIDSRMEKVYAKKNIYILEVGIDEFF